MIIQITNHFYLRIKFIIVVSCLILFTGQIIYAQTEDDTLSANVLKNLSLEELMNIEVTIVSKHPEQLFNTPASVYVISNDDIRHSGVKSLPEALRLAPNLIVAQVNSSQWAISSRGFNNVLANKLLVMIDGRSVYTPLYAGVFWDVNNLLLEDVDRIEVISGPGGNLWGANAVNGIINIVTKDAKETKGLFVEAGSGTENPGFGSLRYGGQLSSNLYYRIYGETIHNGSTVLADNSNANDAWTRSQGGFRLDWDQNENNSFKLQSDYYNGKANPDGGDGRVLFEGGNLLGHWTHTISENSDIQFQSYYDRTWRDFGSDLIEGLSTFNFDAQHRFHLGQIQEITWGIGFRLEDDKVNNLPMFAFLPAHKTLHLYSAFIQDEITLIENYLNVSLGSKLEHNDYTGYEFQPNGRITWTPSDLQIFWVAISHVVRTPSRLERDFVSSITPDLQLLIGNHEFKSEDLVAYELGWRVKPSQNLSFSLATFYNSYDNIRSAEPGLPPFNLPIMISNGVKGKTFGIELSSIFQLNNWWLLHWGYTFFRKNLSIKPYSRDLNRATAESDDPENQFQVQSSMDLTDNVQLNIFGRFVDELPDPYVPSYIEMDVRVGWKLNKHLELNVVGQNLLHNRHGEFIPSSPAPRQIERSVYGKISFSL
jgi:iron complex outermembrane recepter protein